MRHAGWQVYTEERRKGNAGCKKKPCALVVVLLFWLATLDPHGARGAARCRYGGTYRIPVVGELITTDPALVTTPAELELARQVHETLYRLSPDGTLRPGLAQELPRLSDGGAELTIHLRPGLKFHDGTSVTSTEVLASWERLLHPQTRSPHWWLLAPVKGALAFRRGQSTKVYGLEKINRLAFRIRLSASIPGFLKVLTAVPTAPLPIQWLAGKERSQAHPPGCGPFSWQSSKAGSQAMALEAFRDHPLGRPYLDRLVLTPYPSARAAGLAFELKEVHLTFERPSNRSIGSGQPVDSPQLWMAFLAVKPQRLERLPQGFQQAVAEAVDRQSLVDYLVGDQGSATDELVSLGVPESRGKPLRGDPRAARVYFEQMVRQQKGIPPLLLFLVREGQALERAVAERIQVNLVDIGVVVSVVEVARKDFESRLAEGAYDFYLSRPLPLVGDAEIQLMGIVAELEQEPGLEGLLRSLAGLPLGANRAAMLRETARRQQARLPWIPLFQYGQRVFLHDSVRGYSQGVDGLVDLAEVFLVE